MALVVEDAGHQGLLATVGSHAWGAWLDRNGERGGRTERSSVLCRVRHRHLGTGRKLASIKGCGSSGNAECNGRCGCQAGSDLDEQDGLPICRTYGN